MRRNEGLVGSLVPGLKVTHGGAEAGNGMDWASERTNTRLELRSSGKAST